MRHTQHVCLNVIPHIPRSLLWEKPKPQLHDYIIGIRVMLHVTLHIAATQSGQLCIKYVQYVAKESRRSFPILRYM